MDPSPPIQRILETIHRRYAETGSGEVATYIPELKRANPDHFGVAVVTLDGRRYSAGDAGVLFSIQSISKPLVYGLALDEHGEDALFARVGLEPTGDSFNAISLEPGTGRPANPMINAGAIATSALISGGDGLPAILSTLSLYAGRQLTIDEPVYRSERRTGHRNRAIVHLLKNSGIVAGDPEQALDTYFRQCAIAVTCQDLAAMAATLANGGVNPLTGTRVLQARHVESVLSVMGTCGMYDFAGEWVYRIGMPAKSGVAGGILAVLPGQLGIGVFSPPLDSRGNSVRGTLVCQDLATNHGLHMFNTSVDGAAVIRSVQDVTVARSKRQRPTHHEAQLDALGGRALVYELQGNLNFAAAERFTADLAPRASAVDAVALDFRHVRGVASGSLPLVRDLVLRLLEDGKLVIFAEAEHHPLLERLRQESYGETGILFAQNRDDAIEQCEQFVLGLAGTAAEPVTVPFAQNRLFADVPGQVVERLEQLARRRRAEAGEIVVARGDPATSLFLVESGEAMAISELANNEHVRFGTYPPGTCFGETELVGDTLNDHTVVAQTELEYYEVALADLDEVILSDVSGAIALYRNIARHAVARLERANAEIESLSS